MIGSLDRLHLERGIRRLIAPWDRLDSPGVVVGVAEAGEVLARLAVGAASVEHQVAMTPEHRFAIASVTKQFVSAAALLLGQQGLLDLDGDAREVVPELADFPHRVTLRQMMDNTAGLRDFLEIGRFGGVDTDTPIDEARLRAGIARQRAGNFHPGTRYLYSNSNFLLLGDAVARVAGGDLAAALDRLLFQPAGMAATALVSSPRPVLPGLASGYVLDRAGVLVQARQGFPKGGEGGLVSCVDDLLIWHRQLLGQAPLGPVLADQLAERRCFANGVLNPYGAGLEGTSWRGLRVLGHGGLWPGYRTQVLLFPDRALSVVVLTNTGAVDPWILARRIADLRLDARGPTLPGWRVAPAAAVAGRTGTFVAPELGASLTVRVGEGDSAIVDTNGSSLPLLDLGDGRLTLASGTARLALSPDGTGWRATLDAGVTASFAPVVASVPLPKGLVGRYQSTDMATVWTVHPAPTTDAVSLTVSVDGPYVRADGWTLTPLTEALVTVEPVSAWLTLRYDVQVERDAAGGVAALVVSSGRSKSVRFERMVS
ncbi:MAG: serine hydrolase domain-containing protein [Alphaproteobacteria bacterium]|nr:serine hydrolase domain-containing protein [Alphaproteobacteria bacterium]